MSDKTSKNSFEKAADFLLWGTIANLLGQVVQLAMTDLAVSFSKINLWTGIVVLVVLVIWILADNLKLLKEKPIVVVGTAFIAFAPLDLVMLLWALLICFGVILGQIPGLRKNSS